MASAGSPAPALPGHLTAWTSRQVSPASRFDAWADVLDDSFLSWTLNANRRDDFAAAVRQRRFGGYRMLRCACDPFGGQRSVGNIARTTENVLCLLYVEAGVERLRIDGRDIYLGPGDMVLWDSERKMSFDVGARLRKLTLMVPEPQMRTALPRAMDLVGVPVDGRQGIAAVLVDHLKALERQIGILDDDELAALMPATLELLASAYQGAWPRAGTGTKAIALRRVRAYIRAHLRDPSLSPSTIAAANRMSLRYLHLLFEDSGATVAEWIRRQRIERCKRELRHPGAAHRTITEIAFEWGFSDAGHFSKVFRRQVGMTPRAFRLDARQGEID